MVLVASGELRLQKDRNGSCCQWGSHSYIQTEMVLVASGGVTVTFRQKWSFLPERKSQLPDLRSSCIPFLLQLRKKKKCSYCDHWNLIDGITFCKETNDWGKSSFQTQQTSPLGCSDFFTFKIRGIQ